MAVGRLCAQCQTVDHADFSRSADFAQCHDKTDQVLYAGGCEPGLYQNSQSERDERKRYYKKTRNQKCLDTCYHIDGNWYWIYLRRFSNYRNSVFHTGDGKFAGIRHWQQGYSGSAGLRIHYGGSHLYGKYGC